KYIDTEAEILLSAYGEKTKKTGYFRMSPGRRPQEVIYVDKSMGRPTKAKNANKVLFTMQTFVDYPDYYVSDVDFEFPVKITDANPQQIDYAWSPGRVLIDYENSNGVKLQGTLALPAGYEEGKQYPMIVYFYEKMSQNHHSYSQPSYDDRPHACTYTSNGYLFLQPDVIYTPPPGTPGTNAVDCVTAAVQKVIDLGYVDEDRIGLQGHSWGGYQSSFILTQSD
ncbi:MAG: prolyl oligopeptidase family serine peptidase, partial [Planctomycetes bacterium]|nr:prolyl oligopeptidase family serine peptidase [Planctomycetota bacterium]